jgi:glycerol-3-phosphate dehydrogenase
MVTVTGGKWTTYRRMAEDAVNHAASATGLPAKACITKTLPIGKQLKDGDALVHGGVVLNEETIRYFVKEEMAITVEDVLARRTRLLFLNAQEAIAQAQPTAVIMAGILGKDADWVQQQVLAFNKLASQYQL